MIGPSTFGGEPLTAAEEAALALLRSLEELSYDFVTITPESHRRILARSSMNEAKDLRGVFGWSLPFHDKLLPTHILHQMQDGGLVENSDVGLKSKVRVSRIRGDLFLHTSFPTDHDESVFLGPDSQRFADFVIRSIDRETECNRLVDIGTGAGVGGIVAAKALPGAQVELVDVNPTALSHARVNAAHAGISVCTYESDGLAAVLSGFDIAIANPPFIFEHGAPAYRNGGDMHGAQVARDWAFDAAGKLAHGGRIFLYSGSPIIDGCDPLRNALEDVLPELGCQLIWHELDPDIFGEELAKAHYKDVERIAAVGAIIRKASALPGAAHGPDRHHQRHIAKRRNRRGP